MHLRGVVENRAVENIRRTRLRDLVGFAKCLGISYLTASLQPIRQYRSPLY